MISKIILYFNFGLLSRYEASLKLRQALKNNLTDKNKYTGVK